MMDRREFIAGNSGAIIGSMGWIHGAGSVTTDYDELDWLDWRSSCSA